MNNNDSSSSFMKGPKRKRLAKVFLLFLLYFRSCSSRPATLAIRANDAAMARVCSVLCACRTPWTHGCPIQRYVATGERYAHSFLNLHPFIQSMSPSFYASKQCTYTDAAGRPVPATRSFKSDAPVQQQGSSSSDPRNFSQSALPSSPASNQFRVYPGPPSSQLQNNTTEDQRKHARKRFRNERGNPMPVDDLVIDGPISTAPMDRVKPIDLDPALTRELTNCRSNFLVIYYSIQSPCLQYFLPIVIPQELLSTNPHFPRPSATTVFQLTSSWQFVPWQRLYLNSREYAQSLLDLQDAHLLKKPSPECLTTLVALWLNRILQQLKPCASFRCMTFSPTKRARSGAPVFMVLITFASQLILLIGRSRSCTSNCREPRSP